MSKRKPGRPKGEQPPLGTITLRVDAETRQAIEKIQAALPSGVVPLQSTAIRWGLIEFARGLDR